MSKIEKNKGFFGRLTKSFMTGKKAKKVKLIADGKGEVWVVWSPEGENVRDRIYSTPHLLKQWVNIHNLEEAKRFLIQNRLVREGDIEDKPEKAETLFRIRLGYKLDDVEAHRELGVVYLQGGDLDKAISEFKMCLEMDPNNAEAHYTLGDAYRRKGCIEAAIHEFRKAMKINPEHSKAHADFGNAYFEETWSNLISFDEAMVGLRKAMKMDPNDAKKRLGLGKLYLMRGELDEAIAECRKAMEINPVDRQAKEVLEIAEKAKEQGLNLYEIGKEFVRGGMFKEATFCYEKFLETNPNHVDANVELGMLYEKRGMLDKAIISYKRALKLEPSYLDLHSLLAHAYDLLGMVDEATEECEKVLKVMPKDKRAKHIKGIIKKDRKIYADPFGFGNMYVNKKMFGQAICCYKKATELNPKNVEAYVNLGNVYVQLMLTDEALKEYKKALRINPKKATAHYNIALLYYDVGRYDLAWKHAKMAEKLSFDEKGKTRKGEPKKGDIKKLFELIEKAPGKTRENLKQKRNLES